MNRLFRSALAVAIIALAQSVFADTVSYSGNTETSADGSWMHPDDGFTTIDADTTLYSVQAFTVSQDGMYDISSIQGIDSAGTQFDGMIFLYGGTFDPANPLDFGVAADDDGDGGPGTSSIEGVALNAGTTYYLVTTGFTSEDTLFGSGAGPFTNTISGNGDITLSQVPIPAALWLMLSGIVGLRVFQRK